jgi:hypothetical protein
MTVLQTSLRPSAKAHIHATGDLCPVCDQPIPNEKADQVRARMEARERELSAAVSAQLMEQFAQERAQIEARARSTLLQAQKDHATALDKMRSDAEAKVAAARAEIEAATKEKIALAEQEKNAAVGLYEGLKASYATQLGQRVKEVREALEKEKQNAVNAEKAQRFEETQKLTAMVQDLQRRLEKRTSEELGEGAEIDLFERLKAEFPNDRIERIRKGASGADIRHVVVHNGKEAGTIIYESKNDKAWRNDYVDKLAQDQRAAKAEHAILSTLKFPKDTSQLHVVDGVIIASPARVMAVVQVLRQHIIHLHTLRLSNTERAKKTSTLYDFIMSSRCRQLFDAIDTHAEDLLKLQEKEIKAHEAAWKHQGRLYRSIQKVRADLLLEIDRIVETTE